jgi:predicted RNA-binding protein with EMAP domain
MNDKLNEKEVFALAREVEGETLLDPDVEREWTVKQLESIRREEQQTIYSFRMFKALRDDVRMQTAAKTLKDIRGAIGHLTERLKALE